MSFLFAAREANRNRRTIHCLSNLQHLAISEAEHEIRANLTLYVLSDESAGGPVPVQALAQVTDRYREDQGKWLITSRETILLAGGA